jgi:hypothetical protein
MSFPRRHLISLIVAVTVLAFGPGAMACVRPQDFPDYLRLDPMTVADAMVRSATYVDVAVIERFSPDFELATRSRRAWFVDGDQTPEIEAQMEANFRESFSGAVRMHFKVVEHLKGPASTGFEISGYPGPVSQYLEGPYRPRKPLPVTMPMSALKYYVEQQDLAAWGGPGDCFTNVMGEVGQTYLVFRDADGYLLRAEVPFGRGGERGTTIGPALFPVGPSKSAWLDLVRKTLAGPPR